MKYTDKPLIQTSEIKHLSRLILIFAICHAVLIILPAFLSQQFSIYPLIKNGDVLDLLTPLVLIPLYWLLFQMRRNSLPSQKEMFIFLILTVLWVEGHSIHLVSNSIGHLAKDSSGSEIATLTHFYDEKLSHYIWHCGLIGLSALLIYRQWCNPFCKQCSGLSSEIIAGIIYGLTYFIDIIESATTYLGIPFALVVLLFGLLRGRKHLRQQPILVFFLVSYLLASLLFLGWWLYWGEFPEFSEVGIIN